MGSFSGLGIGLSLVFGFVLFGLVAELYYLLWWKKRTTSRRIEENFKSNNGNQIFHPSCWKKPNPENHSNDQETNESGRNPDGNGHEPDLELGTAKDLVLKGLGEEGVEAEIMRLHNLCGPPRFLFTIKEETREDLESDDGRSKGDKSSRKGSRTRSLSDLILALETPLSSPTSKASPYDRRGFGFNPLFESSTDAELHRLRSSPPPKFKFLRDAEEKMIRRLIEEVEKREAIKRHLQDSVGKADSSTVEVAEEEVGSEFTFIVGKKRERESSHQYHSSASQVLPLSSSPLAFGPIDANKPHIAIDLHELK